MFYRWDDNDGDGLTDENIDENDEASEDNRYTVNE